MKEWLFLKQIFKLKNNDNEFSFLCSLLISTLLISSQVFPQTFTRITSGDVVSNGGNSAGSNWIDINNDGWLDLFVANGNDLSQANFLYLGSSGGEFTRITSGEIVTDVARSIGATWGDYDNDGDPDVFVTNRGNQNNNLYENNGDGNFTKITADTIVNDGGDSNISHWLDIDNDGDLDLFVLNFNQVNFLYRNDNTAFTKITTGNIVTDISPSICSIWGDYNNDSYLDLFVANGGSQNNFLYTNNGDLTFSKFTFSDGNSSLGGSWGDYNNDGYLDLFVANFLDQNNILYRNDGPPNFTFTRITSGDIVNDGGRSVGTAWGDFDNDGDLDLYAGNHTQNNFYYSNNNDGSFSKITSGDFVSNSGNTFGVSISDFNGDGGLDIYATNISNQNNQLYQNDGNAGNWIAIKCIGVTSSKDAIGAKVAVKASINGIDLWQTREISAQHGYNSQNGFAAHFGVANASSIDSLVVQWPSGAVDMHASLAINEFITVMEGGVITGISDQEDFISQGFSLHQNFPNPFNPTTDIRFRIADFEFVELKIFDINGREVRTLLAENKAAGLYTVTWDGVDQFGNSVSSGVYLYRIETGGLSTTKKMILIR